MEFSERQLETLLMLSSEREMNEKMRTAVRLCNNQGWSYRLAAHKAGVTKQGIYKAMKKLKESHQIILQGYANYI
ncbi:hypothetical protein [Vibrio quintilis]|uniref:TrfB transcriptional repressor protein domain-containing protein n=1 Tax=Vibrio quintilis TaxID=1117707 RepID=A0A1M7YYZ1_9VIBR|nr:hypothetical protein [Vibrio quintilis]SHO57868.1 hypothetical protein VQ7734_03638 [Vibrio quintilis]